jgi:hypothetical protein
MSHYWYFGSPAWYQALVAIERLRQTVTDVAGYAALYVGYPLVLVGLVTNVLVVAFMWQTREISRKVSMFYISVAACDFGTLVFRYGAAFLPLYINNVIRTFRSPLTDFYLPYYLSMLLQFFADCFPACSAYVQAVLTALRAFVVTFPLSAVKPPIRG